MTATKPSPADTGDEGFFNDHPRFLETSTTAAGIRRLNLRHRAMIEANRDVLAGARVLDIASHDGRWSMAGLEAGAVHVIGIEARPDLVRNTEETFQAYGVDEDAYRFIAEDVFAVLAREKFDIDVICCFGFLYHTLRYPEFFSLLRRLEPRYLLLDTRVHQAERKLIKILPNEVTRQAHAAADDYTAGTTALVGWPTPVALRLMLGTYGFRVEDEFDWVAQGRKVRGGVVSRYRSGDRVTWRCRWDSELGVADAGGDDLDGDG